MQPIRSRTGLLLLAFFAAVVFAAQTRDCAAQWVDGRTAGPFVCRAEFSLAGSENLLRELIQIQADLVKYLGLPEASEQIEVYLFRDKRSYSRFLDRHLPKIPYRRALFIKGQGPGRVYVYRSRELAVDLRHESTHALLHAVLPVVPLWLDEGLAEYFEVPADQRAFDNPHLSKLRWNLRLGTKPKLSDLESKGSLSEMGGAEYRYAWAWVHFMLHGPREAHQELVQFLAALQARTPPGLLSQRLNRHLPRSEQHLVAHFKGWKR